MQHSLQCALDARQNRLPIVLNALTEYLHGIIPSRLVRLPRPTPIRVVGDHDKGRLSQRASKMANTSVNSDNNVHRLNQSGCVTPSSAKRGEISNKAIKPQPINFIPMIPDLQRVEGNSRNIEQRR